MSHSSERRRFLAGCGYLTAGTALGLLAPHGAALLRPDPAGARPAGPGHEERLRKLKLKLPVVPRPAATLVPAVRVGDMLYVSGHGPGKVFGKLGRVGDPTATLTVKQGQAAARQVGLVILSVVRTELGSLDKVVRLVKTLGMVNCTADFKEQPQVINGFSDLMVEVFGETAGKGARSAVGMAALPGGIPVEIEAIFQVRA
jgi:enamine deaminase RidA (YjgF/YER057c/UK114 family)